MGKAGYKWTHEKDYRHLAKEEIEMSLKFRTDELSPAEASLIGWQFGFQDDDDPFFGSLWHVIDRAWACDRRPPAESRPQTEHLKRLAAPGAFPEEVAVFLKFKSADGERYWLGLLRKAGLADRRQRDITPPVERRRRSAATA
jgi:hypothetical protein